jgi:hypothetical protein
LGRYKNYKYICNKFTAHKISTSDYRDPDTKRVHDFNIPLSSDRYRDKINNKEPSEFNSIIGQMDLVDIYRRSYPTDDECTFFSACHGIFSKIEHILYILLKTKVGIMSYTLLDHNGIKFGISSKKICRNCIKHGH